jgi:Pregnancy-associated plasma protein-A
MLSVLALAGCRPERGPAPPASVYAAEPGAAFVVREPAPEPLLEVAVLAIQVADDDGGRAARVAPEHVVRWVAFANSVFRLAGVRLRFDPADFQLVRSSRVNDLEGIEQRDWRSAKAAADQIAARHPDRLVVFFRHGPGQHPSGRGFSWIDYNFVVLPGWLDGGHCGHEHTVSFAHELGHHLGLEHTFARVFPNPSAAAAYLGEHEGDVRVFDGDGLADTAPDPGIRTTECWRGSELQLGGVRVPLARRNIMSYYEEADSLTREQIQRLRWFVRERQAHRMQLPKNAPSGAHELEQLELVASAGARCSIQEMSTFGVGNWSDGRQLFCHSRARELSVTVKLPVGSSALQRIELYATRAPDFGILEVFIDNQPVGVPFDGWAPAVLATGAIALGQHRLLAGSHELSFRVRRKNAASSSYHLGVDAIRLVPIGPSS